MTGERRQNEIRGAIFDLISRRWASVALRLHQAQLARLECHNVTINGVRSEHTQGVGDLKTHELVRIGHLRGLLGLLRSLSNHLVLHRDNIVRLNLSEEAATEVDTVMRRKEGNQQVTECDLRLLDFVLAQCFAKFGRALDDRAEEIECLIKIIFINVREDGGIEVVDLLVGRQDDELEPATERRMVNHLSNIIAQRLTERKT